MKDTVTVHLEMPADMHERIQKIAEGEERSIRRMVLYLLRDSLRRLEVAERSLRPK